MEGRQEVTVAITQREVVTAALPPAQGHRLPMSNLDLLLLPIDVSIFFCYRWTSIDANARFVDVLKKSLSDALVTYYPFAGELVSNSAGEPELLCNNRGVDFVEAHCDDVGLASLPLHDLDSGVMRKLIKSEKKGGVLCIQATELKCGGLVVACTFDHRVADGYSANMFLMSWAETARSIPFSVVPSFRRSLLSPRRGPDACRDDHSSDIDRFYVTHSQLPPPPRNSAGSATPTVGRIYYIAAADVARIQESASSVHGGGKKRTTKLEAFTAYLWHVLGGAGARPAGSLCSMGVFVDGRRQRSSTQCCSSMETYFGNVLSLPYATLAAEELRGMDLAEVADVVHGFVSRAATPEHFMGLVDWIEARRPDPPVSRFLTAVGGGDDDSAIAIMVSSGLHFPVVSELDFGWGRPALASCCFPSGHSFGYVVPMSSTTKDGDWVVYVQMAAELVGVLETAAGDVFRLVTADYLGLTSSSK